MYVYLLNLNNEIYDVFKNFIVIRRVVYCWYRYLIINSEIVFGFGWIKLWGSIVLIFIVNLKFELEVRGKV